MKQAQENINAAESTIAANAANVSRMQELKVYTRLLAPFDGVITYRSDRSDPGTLISAGNTTQSRELIKVSQIDTLRIFVNVPQSYSTLVHAGQTADLIVDELPGRTFPATVRGTTNAVDPATRSLLAVLIVNNPKGDLLPGMYAKIRFALPHMVSVMMLPADALVLKTDGPQAAVVGADHKIHFHKLVVGPRFGSGARGQFRSRRRRRGGAESDRCDSRGRDSGNEGPRSEIVPRGAASRQLTHNTGCRIKKFRIASSTVESAGNVFHKSIYDALLIREAGE